jgi:hypothetical protein
MKFMTTLAVCTAVLGAVSFGAAPAEARGCLKGAAVGGLAGHMAGHGVLGAAGGCAVGHHMANRREQDRDVQDQQYRSDDRQSRQYDRGYR